LLHLDHADVLLALIVGEGHVKGSALTFYS
jgi:hypothetical protein